MRLSGLLLAFAALLPLAPAQSPDMAPQGYTFALPVHPGRLRFAAPTYEIAEYSAIPNGFEYGIRGQSKDGTHLLAFLFLPADTTPFTSESCREKYLQHEEKITVTSRSVLPNHLALAQYTFPSQTGTISVVRAFAATGDLCADIEFSSQSPITPETPSIHAAFASVQFEPNFQPTFREVFAYATVLFEHHAAKAAAPLYERALTLLPANPPTEKWRRVATDQAAMSYGMSGNIEKARSILNRAIAADPTYPLNYYNLACADAEQGDAIHARIHLQQAFDRKANTLPGESLPYPAEDDSIQKLKGNKEFWAFVESLQKK